MNLKKAIHALLSATNAVTSKLTTYDFGNGLEPAIHTSQKKPERRGNRHAMIEEIHSDPWDTRAYYGGEGFLDIGVFGDNKFTDEYLYAAAAAIYETIHRGELTVDNYDVMLVLASPPVQATDDRGFPGYRIEVRTISTRSS